jgi:hypothetical protein
LRARRRFRSTISTFFGASSPASAEFIPRFGTRRPAESEATTSVNRRQERFATVEQVEAMLGKLDGAKDRAPGRLRSTPVSAEGS